MAGTNETTTDLHVQVREWLARNWDPALSVDEWWRLVGAAGWTAPHFTADQGGHGLDRPAITTVRAAFVEAGALPPPGGLGLLMAAPTILAHGTPDQIARFVPPITSGAVSWCQLFSEPGAGSDLAGLTTRAERDGDHWVITGQKVWSSMAMQSDYGMLLARTDFGVAKHAGISWFAFPLDQPGVTIRPLREMTGDSVFNEVFLDGAICADADLIGGEGNGWKVTQTTLFYERTGLSGGTHTNWPIAGPKGGFLGRSAGDAAGDVAPVADLVMKFTDLVELARSLGRTDDPQVRQDLARLDTFTKLSRWNAERAKAAGPAGQSIANVGKLLQTMIMKLSGSLGVDILGADGMLSPPDGIQGGRFAKAFVFSAASSIYGGTDQIQRNIIAERVLGLPRDDMPGKGQPYGEVLRATSSRT